MLLQENQDLFVPAHLNFGLHVLKRLRAVNADNVCLVSTEFILNTVSAVVIAI